MIYLQLALGFVLLVAGGEALVRGAVSLAARLKVSPLLIGLTLVGFGTSTPELVTSLQAAFDGYPGIAVGNVVGSNTANILLILGVAAMITPMSLARKGFLRDGIALAAATALCAGVVLYGALDRSLGAIFLAGLFVYLGVAYLSDRENTARAAEIDGVSHIDALPGSNRMAFALAVGGIGITILGARLAVDAAVVLAGLWGISETVVGLTIVAVGTSLPELVTSVMAALRREQGIAFGNVVGSNIYNILGILGVTAVVKPIAVPPQIAQFGIWVMGAATLGLIAVVGATQRISRGVGLLSLGAYAGYIYWLV
ncbi:calcium/sodium antiporter [Roseobacter sp. GAI101]|uniref:calcium/sodium antiporter n=1 Tax=Roseobacter sp. (strain GAI101) TaxID=391589 RepID=UPI000187191D|nr:calcium/sodium antiporter [Roseobacter sp. GAI101]EEB82466.1 putative K+-dependent Na+/Ca+ exchanger [Roseobacter sp. GAI101]